MNATRHKHVCLTCLDKWWVLSTPSATNVIAANSKITIQPLSPFSALVGPAFSHRSRKHICRTSSEASA